MPKEEERNIKNDSLWRHLRLRLRGSENLDGPYLPIKFGVHLVPSVPSFDSTLNVSEFAISQVVPKN